MNIGSLTATLGVDTKSLLIAQQHMIDFQKTTNASLSAIQAKLNEIGDASTKAAEKVQEIAKPVTPPISGIQAFNNSLKAVSTTLDKTGRNIYYFGTAATKFLTVPLAGASIAITKTAKDYEYSMQKIVGLVGVSQTQVNAWNKELLQMGPALGKGPKELADALYFVTSSGFKGAEALDIVQKSAKASAAGLGETKSVADLVTSAMSAYSSSGLTASHTLDILTAAVREGKGEAADYANHLGDIIPVASQMGISFDQVAGAISAVTLTGQNVSKAVTGIRQALFEIEKPSAESIKNAKAMGISFGELQNVITNKGLLAGLKMMSDLTKKHGDDLSSVFPNIRAYNSILSLLGDRYTENVSLIQRVIGSTGSLENAYKAIGDTIEQKYNQAVSSVQASLIKMGLALKDSIIPIMGSFAKMIENIVNWYTSLSTGTQQFILKLGIFLAAIGPVTIAVGLFMRALGGIISTTATVIRTLTALNAIMIANPMMAMVATIGLLVGAFYMLTRNTGEAQKELSKYNDEVERGKALAASQQSITDQMAVINNLNKTQIAALKERIQEELRLEDQRGADILAKEKKAQDDYIKSLSDTVIREKAALGTAMKDKELLFAQGQTYEKNIKQLNDYLKTVDSKLKTMGTGSVNVTKSPLENYHHLVLEEYKTFLYSLKKSGEDFVTETTTIKDKLGKTQYVMTAKMNIPEIDTGPVESYRRLLLVTSDAGNVLQKKLADVALQNSIFGDTLDTESVKAKTLSDQMRIVADAMTTLIDNGIRPGDDSASVFGMTLDQLIVKFRELQNASKESFTAIANNMSQIGGEVNNFLGNISSLLQANKQNELSALQEVQDARRQAQDEIDVRNEASDAMANAKNEKERSDIQATLAKKLASMQKENEAQKAIASEKEAIEARYRSTMKALAISQAVINTAIAVTAAWTNPITAPVIIPLIIASGAAQVATIEAQQMANGGIVPEGYPNDTYPARLTSGEMVVPPGKLPNIQGGGISEVNVTVSPVLKGTDIHFIVKEVERKYKSSMI